MNLIERILSVFQKNYPIEERDTIWNNCMSMAKQTELNESNLENMCRNTLTSGFVGDGGKEEIVKLAQALQIPDQENLDDVLDNIQSALPFPINFPEFHGNCIQGLQTKYGIATNRHVWYLWVLKRILELCPNPNIGIIEIGAGFGVLGYYLDRAGYRDYTTIDLAMANACQTYFLSRNLPGRNVIVSGDVLNPFDQQYEDSIKLLHSTDFKDVPKGRFGIMVNMDGLTEMGIEHATKYAKHDCASMMLSINHEMNSYRVCDIIQPHRNRKYRNAFLLRDAYIEELYV